MSSRDPSPRELATRAAELERELAAARDEVRTLQTGAAQDAADVARLRAALGGALAQSATLERDPEVVQAAAFKKRLAEAEAARATAERAAGKAMRESKLLDEQLATARDEIRSTREQMTADAVNGATIAHELAELRREVEVVKARSLTSLLTATTQLELRISEMSELGTFASARADQAETKLRVAESRAQGAETSLEQATVRARTAELRVAHLEKQASSHTVLARKADEEYAHARKQVVALEAHVAALSASIKATAPESARPVVGGPTQKVSERAAELEHVAVAGEIFGKDAPSVEATDRAIRTAAALADKQIREAARRVEIAENRVSASETITKAMARDVAEALRRAVDAELKVRRGPEELEAAHHRAEQAEAEHARAVAAIADTERRAADAGARASELESELQGANAQVRRLKNASEATLESTRRELAAERSTTVALADCKRQLDSELATIRAQLATAITRAGAAEQRNIELELEVAVADSVRSFAVEAEGEIAQVRQQLHETRSALSDLAVERDRSAAVDYETQSERAPTNPIGQQTVTYDASGLQELFRRTAALEDQVVELERENAQLREALARAKRRIR